MQQWNVTVEQDLGHDIGLRFSYIGSHGSNLETFVDLNQVPANTVGWNTAFAQSAPFQSWDYIQSIVNGAQSNYDSMSVAFTRRFSHGLQFQSSYLWTRGSLRRGRATRPLRLQPKAAASRPTASTLVATTATSPSTAGIASSRPISMSFPSAQARRG